MSGTTTPGRQAVSMRAPRLGVRAAAAVGAAAGAIVLLLATACAATAPADVDRRLGGDTIAMLGEVHDNAAGHAERLSLLRAALERGWRPVIAMEQFDTDRQAALDAARAQFPDDARRLIDAAASSKTGWDWPLYEPVVALALQYRLPLIAANLSGGATGQIVRGGYAAGFAPERIDALGLARVPDAAWQAAQEREIDAGHCGMLPARAWPAMARAQFARDAVMAEVLRTHGAGGIVLLAGNGHVRRDLGVARWLAPAEQARTVSIGYLEVGPGSESAAGGPPEAAFDRVVRVAAAPREDPCVAFKGRGKPAS
jgi:uncharacterized iron-regulated protein